MMTMLIRICLLSFFTTSALREIATSACDKTAVRGDGFTCYKVIKIEDNYENAESFCQQYNMHLPSIASKTEEDAIVNLLQQNSIVEAWIGLKQTISSWKWPDGSELMEQGCYEDSSCMTYNENKPGDNGFATCSKTCKSSKYVGLMNGTRCYCGDCPEEFGQLVSQCRTPCPSPSNELCGGINSQRIVLIDGAYSDWSLDQPNGGGDESQLCSIISSRLDYKWNDVGCSGMRIPAICEIRLSPQYLPTCDTTRPGVYLVESNGTETCIYVANDSMNYFEAIEECTRFNGKLLKIINQEQVQVLRTVLSEKYPTVEDFWIGATKLQFAWISGENIAYISWNNLPLNKPISCGFINSGSSPDSKSYWSTDGCSASKFTVCQSTNATYVSEPKILTTTTSVLPITKIIILPPSTTRPTLPGANPPLANDNTVRPRNNPELGGIIGGAIGGGVILLIIVIITIVIIVVICKRKQPNHVIVGKSESVQPSYFFGIDMDDGTLTSNKSSPKIYQSFDVADSSNPPLYINSSNPTLYTDSSNPSSYTDLSLN